MDELRGILWQLNHRKHHIEKQARHSVIHDDKTFWLGEKVANDRAISIVEKLLERWNVLLENY